MEMRRRPGILGCRDGSLLDGFGGFAPFLGFFNMGLVGVNGWALFGGASRSYWTGPHVSPWFG